MGYGHLLGMWLVPCHSLRCSESDRTAWGCRNGSDEVQGGYRMWYSLLRGHPADRRFQYFVGPSVSFPEPRTYWSSSLGSSRVKGRGKVSVRWSSKPRVYVFDSTKI